jgi:thioredoxin 1
MSPRIIHLENRADFKELLKKERAVIVKAGAGWCGPCKEITPYFDEYTESYLNNKFIIVKLDVDSGSDLASYLKIKSIQQLFYYKDGSLQNTMVGSDKNHLKKFFEKLLKNL